MVEKEEYHHVFDVLVGARVAFEQKNILALKELSNKTIHTASVIQDSDSITIAVLIYALSKIIERSQYQSLPGWEKFQRTCDEKLEEAVDSLKRHDQKNFLKNLQEIQESLSKVSGSLKLYVQDVFRKARINKASKMYEHGISLGKTAKLLGVTLWELSQYTGQRETDTHYFDTKDVKIRAKEALRMFS